MPSGIYTHPLYYAIAFDFRDMPREVDFFEAAARKFSKTPVRNVLELASGPGPYLEEWHRRGYRYCGLDSSAKMLDYVRQRAAREHIPVKLLRANMNRFTWSGSCVDLAYVLLGSFFASSNLQFLKHLDCVAGAVRRGGLYLLDGVVWFHSRQDRSENWTISRNGINVRCRVRWSPSNEELQTVREDITLDVRAAGVRKQLQESVVKKLFFPQEFLSLVDRHGKFTFCGWFKDFDLAKPAGSQGRSIVVLRRK
ncbi:MAG: class I SAM-dependent methyltransferase [Acidobacteria bacterium]|nr:class I SAM-dependent methyltransferase [Acidobacteriota bacterium]